VKKLKLLTLLLTILVISVHAQQKGYDAELAKKLGADDMGMKNYVLVLLKTGPANITDKILRDSLFMGHMKNINMLADSGKLVVAGPFGKNSDGLRGLFILNTPSIDVAREMLRTDPTIRENIFEALYYPWYGSAALSEYLEAARKIEKTLN